MLSDEALYERMVAGELGAFDLLYERYERPLFGFVLKHLSDRAEAEDVLHEAFLGLLRARRIEGASFRAWLFQVARNLCLNRFRTRTRASRALSVVARDGDETVEAPQQQLERHQAVVALQDAVERLPETLAELYHLRVAGLSYEEMASVVRAPLGTVKSRMHELVARLREEMKPWTAR
ncbi:MAG: RNA polymerase sigma factor [Myxococcales bacterium]|jgi:RNA polymerase sigma-70 factor (ECF subfamily)